MSAYGPYRTAIWSRTTVLNSPDSAEKAAALAQAGLHNSWVYASFSIIIIPALYKGSYGNDKEFRMDNIYL